MSQPDPQSTPPDDKIPIVGWITRVVIAIIIVGIGVAGFAKLKLLRRKPPTREYEESVRDVVVHSVSASPEVVTLSGYGTVRSRKVAQISSEVSGVVVEVFADLNDGTVVEKGTVLCRIDDEELKITKQTYEAEGDRIDAEIKVLEQQATNAKKLLVLRKEAAALDETEYKRVSKLLKDSGIGSQAVVDRARQMWIRSREAVTTLENNLTQIPLQLLSLKTQKKRVAAQLKLADLNLKRCELKAPFRGRLLRPGVEVGQTVMRGQPIMALSDDSDRIITVSLDGRDAARWLPFADTDAKAGWFRKLKPVSIDIVWLEQPDAGTWKGTLSRISSYDERTRTVHVVARINMKQPETTMALVPGMFCEAKISGGTIQEAMRFPRSAINADGHVFVVVEGRLASRSFKILRREREDILAHPVPGEARPASLRPGDSVVVTKLSSPVDGMQVRVVTRAGPSSGKPTD